MYSLIFDEKSIELPKYSFEIADRLTKVEAVINSGQAYKKKCEEIFKFEKELLGKEIVDDIVGDFSTCDPNDIMLLYMGIVDCYNQPIVEKKSEQLQKTFDSVDLSKISKLTDSINKLENFK